MSAQWKAEVTTATAKPWLPRKVKEIYAIVVSMGLRSSELIMQSSLVEWTVAELIIIFKEGRGKDNPVK